MTSHAPPAVEDEASKRPARPRIAYYPELTGIRALAAVMVVLGHAWPRAVGHVGVGSTVAFALSGFLIGGRLMAEVESRGSIDVRRFLARRSLRLLPAALVMIVVTSLVLRPRWVDLVLVCTHLTNWALAEEHSMGPFGHLWSLSVEEQFYAIMPFALMSMGWIARRRGLALRRCVACMCLVGIVLAPALRLWLWDDGPRWYYGTDTRLDSLLVGVLGAAVLPWVGRRIPSRAFPVAAGLSLVALLAAYAQHREVWVGTVLTPLLAAVLVVSCTAGEGGLLVAVLRSRIVQWVGTISYGIYLWHFPLLRMAPPLQPRYRYLLVPLVSVVCAAISWYALERPLNRWLGPKLRARVPRRSGATRHREQGRTTSRA